VTQNPNPNPTLTLTLTLSYNVTEKEYNNDSIKEVVAPPVVCT